MDTFLTLRHWLIFPTSSLNLVRQTSKSNRNRVFVAQPSIRTTVHGESIDSKSTALTVDFRANFDPAIIVWFGRARALPQSFCRLLEHSLPFFFPQAIENLFERVRKRYTRNTGAFLGGKNWNVYKIFFPKFIQEPPAEWWEMFCCLFHLGLRFAVCVRKKKMFPLEPLEQHSTVYVYFQPDASVDAIHSAEKSRKTFLIQSFGTVPTRRVCTAVGAYGTFGIKMIIDVNKLWRANALDVVSCCSRTVHGSDPERWTDANGMWYAYE